MKTIELTSLALSISLAINSLENIWLQKNLKELFSLRVARVWLLQNIAIIVLLIVANIVETHAFVWASVLALQWGNIVLLRSPFMGGADQMNLLTTATVVAVGLGYENAQLYLGAQVILSYAVAALSRIFDRGAWTGESVKKYVAMTQYQVPTYFKHKISQNLLLAKCVSIGVILFELGFVGVLFCSDGVFGVWIILGIIFHLANYAMFGLNRFVWAWLAAYPACFYLKSFF